MSKKLVMGVRSLCAVGSWEGERERQGGREGRRRELEAEEGWLRRVVGAILINCFAVLCTTFLL